MSSSYERKVVARFKSNLKKKILWNSKLLNKKNKITQDLIENIQNYWKFNDGKIYTLNDVKLFIDKKYLHKDYVSTSTISKILKWKLGMSYKRMNVLNSSINFKKNINRIIEVLSVQAKLLNDCLMSYF